MASTSNGWSFGYDANGNMNSYKGNSIGWTSYNLPSTINAAGQSSQFAYGPNRNRWRQIASYPTGIETTIYVGGILEKVVNGLPVFPSLVVRFPHPVELHCRRAVSARVRP